MERPAESQRNQDELVSNGATEALSKRMMLVGSTQKATRAGTTNAKPTSEARQTDAVPRGSTPQTPAGSNQRNTAEITETNAIRPRTYWYNNEFAGHTDDTGPDLRKRGCPFAVLGG